MTRRGTRRTDQTPPRAMIAAAAIAIGVLASLGLVTIVDTGCATIKYTKIVSTSQTYGARRRDAPRRSSSRVTATQCRFETTHATSERQCQSRPRCPLTTPEPHAESLRWGDEDRRRKTYRCTGAGAGACTGAGTGACSTIRGVASTVPQNQDRANFGSPAMKRANLAWHRIHRKEGLSEVHRSAVLRALPFQR
jgi:hypothetical protein